MLINLHKNATTTPAIREAIQNATGNDYELARQFNVTRDTIRKWRKRDTVTDGSHTPHRLQSTLNAGQEELVIYLRTHLRLPLDDLLAVVREFIEPAMSRSALDRLLRRRGHSRLPVPEKAERTDKPFKAYEPGYVHVDVKYLPQMADESARRYVFVAINRGLRAGCSWPSTAGYALGVRGHQAPQDGSRCTVLPERADARCAVPDSHASDR